MIREWLRARVPDFYNLPEAEKKAIADFSLLWPLFEGRILGAMGSVTGICKAVDAWEQAGTLHAESYCDELTYFRQRYFSGGAPNERFGLLQFRKGDREDLVRAVLADPDSPAADQVKASLIIVFRYRCNMFHGSRWQHKLRDKLENFNVANSILLKTLDRHGRLADDHT